jgi:DnaJ domain
MAKDPYAILGVGRGAPLSEIKRAYRKLAFSLHPDVGDEPDETRFREAHEAYQAMIQMEQRRPRSIKVVRAPDRSGHAGTMYVEPRGRPEPIRRRPPVNVIDDFGTVSPSVARSLTILRRTSSVSIKRAAAHAGTWASRSSWTEPRPSSASACRSRFRCTRDAIDAGVAEETGVCAPHVTDTGWPKRAGRSRSKSLPAPAPASATSSI